MNCNTEPCVILLDLNMPGIDGFEFLKIAKADEALRDIPVVVVTTSLAESDRTESLRRGAAERIVKSIDYEEFMESIKATLLRWTTCEMPPNDG